jgi:hypothetical protein
MAESFNIYLDESCHLQNDHIRAMGLGAVWCPQDKTREISVRVRDIKLKHDLATDFELKWTKVSPAKLDFYLSIVDYFLDDDDLHFRGVVIPDKRLLDHDGFNQDHDSWYYKMCFTLLEPIIDPTQHYSIYLDIKDTRSEIKRAKLEEVLRNAKYDGSGNIVRRVQQIRSHESELLQITDLLLGALVYTNRGLAQSAAKQAIVNRLRQRTRLTMNKTTWLREPKFNLLIWRAKGTE